MKKLSLHTVKRAASIMLTGAMAMLALSASATNDKVKVDKLYYYLDDETKTAEIATTEDTTEYATGRLTIPSSVSYNGDTYYVTAIGDFAFSYCTGITSVTVPTTIVKIGAGAFQGCSKINTVLFQVPQLEEIGDAAFEGCATIGSITLPATLKKLGAWAFAGCTGLRSASIPENVEYIGKNTFMRCTSITVAAIKCPITEIPDGIFDHCTALVKVTLPDSINNNIKRIGIASFYDCPKLTSFAFGDSIVKIDACSFMSCTGLGAVSLPSTVEYIGHDAFSACQKMTAINIPDAVDSIGDHAFKDAHSLKQISMSDSVKFLGEQAFAYCNSLTSARISNQITEIPFKAFAGCTSLTDFTLPTTITSIADSAFQGTKCFDTLKLTNITNVGDFAFADCGTIKYIYLSENIKTFGNGVFRGDTIYRLYAGWDNAPAVSGKIFARCDTLYVPTAKLVYYYKKEGWKDARKKLQYDRATVGIADVRRKSRDNDIYYTIDGVRVLEPEKGGLYIHNGKKVIVR